MSRGTRTLWHKHYFGEATCTMQEGWTMAVFASFHRILWIVRKCKKSVYYIVKCEMVKNAYLESRENISNIVIVMRLCTWLLDEDLWIKLFTLSSFYLFICLYLDLPWFQAFLSMVRYEVILVKFTKCIKFWAWGWLSFVLICSAFLFLKCSICISARNWSSVMSIDKHVKIWKLVCLYLTFKWLLECMISEISDFSIVAFFHIHSWLPARFIIRVLPVCSLYILEI